MKKRCLMFYPWNLDEPSGALSLFLAYSKALKAAGYRLDCYAPRGAAGAISDGLCHGVFENVFVAPNPGSPVSRHLETLGGLCEDSVLPEQAGRNEASMMAAAVLVSISDYDVVGIQYTRCHSLKQMLPRDMPVVVFTHDLDSLVAHQAQTVFGTHTEYHLEDEASRLKPFDLVTVVGPDDRLALHSVDRNLPIVEAPFTSPIENPIAIRKDSPGVLLWISSAAAFHRVSFSWFWNNVWPKIRSERPECRLVIAGRISDAAKQMGAASDPQVRVLGVVQDVEPLYRDADIVLAPYYFGLGIKTKVIEALAKGLPVATTSLGIYNTNLEPGRDVVVSDDASEYARQVIQLISSPAFRSKLAYNGREYVRRWHDPEKALQPFVEAFEQVRLSRKTPVKSLASVQRALAEPLRHLVPWAVQRCRAEGVKTVAIYGAGSHTMALIPAWQSLGGPAIRLIVVSGRPAEARLMGFPVVSADAFDPSEVDAIVLSSNGYEQEMAAICASRWPELRVEPIWRPLVAAEAVCHERIPSELYEKTSPVFV
jgi:hypothetical protein